ncbi:NAD(P)/FAD-dependent oxidoreductase [Asticcacaulis benevestitus]|nr:FAD-binding oxidoreductase [Asticcacaulis benevestitus]
MTAPQNILVLGGGVVGLNLALQLLKEGKSVTLCDDGNAPVSASYGNAGHIAIEQVEPLASLATVRSAWRRLFIRGGALSLPPQGIGAWLPFSLRLLAAAAPRPFKSGKVALSEVIAKAMPAWQRRVADLEATDLLREDGHFVVWETPESAAKGLRSWRATDTGTASFREVTEAEKLQLSSLIHRNSTVKVHGAIRFEGTAQIADTKRLLETLQQRFIERGGKLIKARADKLSITGDGAAVLLSDGDWRTADAIIVSAGMGSKDLMEQAGLKVPMISERGYHIQSHDHQWPQGLPPVVFEDRSMIVTGFESGLRAASFVEFTRAGTAPDPRKWARLRKHVGELGLPFGGQGQEWIGTRPTLPDYLPAIGRVASVKNLYYAFGHQHLGLTLAAITGEIVADMIRSGEGPKPFDLARFN